MSYRCGFSRVIKEGEGGPGNGPLAPVDVWRGKDVHVDVAGRGRKRLPQGIAVPPSVHKASFQNAVRTAMDNLWRVKGFVFKNDTYPPKTPAPTGGGGSGPAAGPGALVPAGMDVRYTGSPPKGVHREKYRGGSAPGGAGSGAVEAMETVKHLPGQHDQEAHGQRASYHDIFANYANNPRTGWKPLWKMLNTPEGQRITRRTLQGYFERTMERVYEFTNERDVLKRIVDEDPWVRTAWKKEFDNWHDNAEITIYRGVRPGEEAAAGPFRSYTLNPRVAQKFASGTFGGGSGIGFREEVEGGKVLKRKVRPKDIMGFFTGGFESEVIMPTRIVGKAAVEESCEECYN